MSFQPFNLTFEIATQEQAQALWFYLNTSETIIEEVNQEYDTSVLSIKEAIDPIENAWDKLDNVMEDQDLIPARRVIRQLTRKSASHV